MFLGVLGIIQKTMGSLFLSAFDLWSAPLWLNHTTTYHKLTKNYPAQDICFYNQLFEDLFSFLNQMNMVSRQMQCTISKINPKLHPKFFLLIFSSYFLALSQEKMDNKFCLVLISVKVSDSLNYNRIFAFKQIFWFRNSSYKHSYISSTDF